ncbi:hypothetical protein C8Q73DRAFT_648362, partial [Cubamyces lactineus]
MSRVLVWPEHVHEWAQTEGPGEELEDTGVDEDEDGWETELEADQDDIRQEVHLIDKDKGNTSPPLLEEGTSAETGTRAQSPDYQFCPPAHRLPILRLFAKHASQHSLLPERHGKQRSTEDIYRDAVEEMYRHCKLNNLCEVWAYLWNSWYSRPRWKLWARSAYAASIPRKQTTMVVEALWRGIKCLVLHMYNRPRIDLALYAIVTRALPPY